MRNVNDKIGKSSITSWVDKYRIFLLFGFIFLFMSLFAPRFFNSYNLTSIMRTVAMNGVVAIGFTIVMICGQLDLSIGTIITFSAVIALGLKPVLGYGVSVPLAVVAGAVIGLLNGVLVAKAKINSFIVTLGMMTVLQGAIYTGTGGNTIALSTDDAFAVSDFLTKMIIPLITPRVLITLVLVGFFTLIMQKTRVGRNFYMVGGNRMTAWLAGINTNRYTIGAFILSGTLAGLGGVFFAMEQAATTLKLGETSLMYVISATIIGGTAMSGGKGGILKSFFAILTLEVMYTGIVLFGLGNEVKIFIAGLILAFVILYEAFTVYRHEKIVGQRPELIAEMDRLKASR